MPSVDGSFGCEQTGAPLPAPPGSHTRPPSQTPRPGCWQEAGLCQQRRLAVKPIPGSDANRSKISAQIPTSSIKSMSNLTSLSLGFLTCKEVMTHFSYPPSGTWKLHNSREQHSLRNEATGCRGFKRGAAHARDGALQWELALGNCTLTLPFRGS